jgi:hypothetical protein
VLGSHSRLASLPADVLTRRSFRVQLCNVGLSKSMENAPLLGPTQNLYSMVTYSAMDDVASLNVDRSKLPPVLEYSNIAYKVPPASSHRTCPRGGLDSRHLESRPKAATLVFEGSAGGGGEPIRSRPMGGDALLLSTGAAGNETQLEALTLSPSCWAPGGGAQRQHARHLPPHQLRREAGDAVRHHGAERG